MPHWINYASVRNSQIGLVRMEEKQMNVNVTINTVQINSTVYKAILPGKLAVIA